MTKPKTIGATPIKVKVPGERSVGKRIHLRIEGDFFAGNDDFTPAGLTGFGDDFLQWCEEGELLADGAVEIEAIPL